MAESATEHYCKTGAKWNHTFFQGIFPTKAKNLFGFHSILSQSDSSLSCFCFHQCSTDTAGPANKGSRLLVQVRH
ncbi:MAG: hypothetical protein GY752_10465 [bacterium]|nr:hypothetical protein [bacterium]